MGRALGSSTDGGYTSTSYAVKISTLNSYVCRCGLTRGPAARLSASCLFRLSGLGPVGERHGRNSSARAARDNIAFVAVGVVRRGSVHPHAAPWNAISVSLVNTEAR
jgi:hypothetical protein